MNTEELLFVVLPLAAVPFIAFQFGRIWERRQVARQKADIIKLGQETLRYPITNFRIPPTEELERVQRMAMEMANRQVKS